MNLNFQPLVPEDFADDSRVWIYQCNRAFTISEVIALDELLENFAVNWKSHGAPVKGFAKIFFGQFIIIMADERATGVSGCSTDSSVRLIKSIEQDHKVELFNRQDLAFIVKEHLLIVPLQKLNDAVIQEIITGNTLYFNNTVLTKKEFLQKWIIPVDQSWLANKIGVSQ